MSYFQLIAGGNELRAVPKSGTYEVKEGTDYITITLDGVVYKGVLMEMTDEAENPVFCFSAAGDNEETLWGVQYIKKE